jgi:hypothetical protein
MRDVDYHAEITAAIVVTQTTESYVVHSAGGKKGNGCKFWYALVHIQVGFYSKKLAFDMSNKNVKFEGQGRFRRHLILLTSHSEMNTRASRADRRLAASARLACITQALYGSTNSLTCC